MIRRADKVDGLIGQKRFPLSVAYLILAAAELLSGKSAASPAAAAAAAAAAAQFHPHRMEPGDANLRRC